MKKYKCPECGFESDSYEDIFKCIYNHRNPGLNLLLGISNERMKKLRDLTIKVLQSANTTVEPIQGIDRLEGFNQLEKTYAAYIAGRQVEKWLQTKTWTTDPADGSVMPYLREVLQ